MFFMNSFFTYFISNIMDRRRNLERENIYSENICQANLRLEELVLNYEFCTMCGLLPTDMFDRRSPQS